MQYSFKTIIQPPFQGSFLLSPLSGPLRRKVGGGGWGGWGGGGGVMSLLSECEIWLFHILRSSPCPFQCFTCLNVTCCNFI